MINIDLAATAGSAFDISGWFILVITTIGAVVGLSAYIYHLLSFKHKFRIKKLTGTKTVVIDDKAKEFTDKSGVTWWRLLRMKHTIQVPPADCLDVTTKGKHSVEAYYSDESGYQFEQSAALGEIQTIKDKGLAFVVPLIKKKFTIFNIKVAGKKVRDDKRGKYVYVKDKDPDIVGTDVLKTKQKVIMVDQLEKAKTRKGFNWREHIPLIVGASAMIIMVAIIFIFFGNIVEPIKPLVQQLDSTAQAQKETTQMLQEMIQKKQIIPAGMVTGGPPIQTNGTGVPPT